MSFRFPFNTRLDLYRLMGVRVRESRLTLPLALLIWEDDTLSQEAERVRKPVPVAAKLDVHHGEAVFSPFCLQVSSPSLISGNKQCCFL